MLKINRLMNISELLARKSYFLWGPRQTGKSWLIWHSIESAHFFSLLDSQTFLRLSHSPSRMREEILAQASQWVVIDEIQKLPELLDEVHLMIEKYRIHFLLTGSSPTKLRRAGVNLLGGRARTAYLFPFSYMELKTHFSLPHAINHGLLPGIYFSDDPDSDLRSYVGLYLQEEIAAEGLSRNIGAFSRFLEVAALCNGTLLNYSKISNDAQVSRSTVQEYFQILKNTLIAYEVLPFKSSKKRKSLSTSKFYFFDTGVVRVLQNRNFVNPGTPEFGQLFESYIFHELNVFAHYHLKGHIYYWRTTSNIEVDFILEEKLAIEVKGSTSIHRNDLKGLLALKEENICSDYILICLDPIERLVDGIHIMPWDRFLVYLWERKWV